MLQSHFPSLGDLADRLGRGYRLERSAFDAAQPYVQRAFAPDARPVTVHLLPPARLMAQTYLPRIRLAAERVTAAQSPHLLRVLDLAADRSWFAEEAAPRINVATALRLRHPLTTVEAACLLREIDRAVRAAEALGLPAVVLAPQQVFLDFITKSGGSASPADDELSTQSIDRWPPFRIRIRAHPVTAQFIQPQRFRRERLLTCSVPAHPESAASMMAPPTAADYAALFAHFCGGSQQVPVPLAPLVSQTLAGSGEPDRGRFLDQILALVPNSTKPVTRGDWHHKERTPTVRTGRKSSARGPGKGPAAARIVSPLQPAVARPGSVALEPASGATMPPPDFRALSGDADGAQSLENQPGGFAEILFGRSPPPNKPTDGNGRGFDAANAPVEDADEEGPVGALFAGGWPLGTSHAEPKDFDPMDFRAAEPVAAAPGLGRLLVLVIVAALVIAVIMAHLTGLAPWR